MQLPSENNRYVLPPLDLLEQPTEPAARNIADDLQASAKILKDTIHEFGIEVESGDITKGPTVTLFELHPAPGVLLERIALLSNNIAMAMRVEEVRILAPVPGKRTVGVEVPNISRTMVYLRDMLESPEWQNHKSGVPVALGRDVRGRPIIGDLAQMPHLLIAGASGSGKTVCVNTILASLLYRYTAEDLRLVLIDLKMVEMQHYQNLPHLLAPVITESRKVPFALGWVICEMEKRFQIFAKAGVRNLNAFNTRPEKPAAADKTECDNLPSKLPLIVVVVEELADLMETLGKDAELAIARLTALGRAAGIHLIVATQRPSVHVVTGVIKANIPARIAFQVASMQDSRVILDSPGAEKLLGKGDMLYEPGSGKAVRAQGVLVLDREINRIVDFISAKAKPTFDSELEFKLKRVPASPQSVDADDIDEDLIQQCIEVIRQSNRASVSILQHRLRISYNRASRIIKLLEERGIVGPPRGAEPREILDEELRKHCVEIINPKGADPLSQVGDMTTGIRNSAKAIIIRDGQVLLIQNGEPGNAWYVLPGGGQNHEEPLHETVRRECLEEVGVLVQVGKLRLVREFIGKNHDEDDGGHRVEFMFECQLASDAIPSAGVKADACQTGVVWAPLAKLSDYPLYPVGLDHILRTGVSKVGFAYMGDVA